MSIDGLVFRPPTADDAQRTHELIVRREVQDYGGPDTDLGDLAYDWERMDLAHDAWLVHTPAGNLVGYGAVIPHGSNLRYELCVDPSWDGLDLGQALLTRCEARGRAIAKDRSEDLVARTYVAHDNRQGHEIVQGAGFRLVMVHYQMEQRLDVPIPAPVWPEGVSVRVAVPEQDYRAVHDLIETAFTWPGRTPTTYEQWRGLMLNDDIYRPELWFLAVRAETIAGACLCFAYPEQGWVRQLAVVETWRRRGIGSALLCHAFRTFREQGYERAGLIVESENPRAMVFYEQLGMQRVRQHDEYERAIGSHH
jgi:ribosomal protein S18 acetylase RimI-like enzyme